MKRFLIAGLAATVLTGAASLAQARTDVVFSVDLGFPQPVYVQPQPVYLQPQPVYLQPRPIYVRPQPVYVQPQPVYVQPQPVYAQPRGYYDRWGRWVEIQAPVVIRPAPVVRYEYERRFNNEREWERGEWRHHPRWHRDFERD